MKRGGQRRGSDPPPVTQDPYRTLPLPASWVVVADPSNASKTHYKDLATGMITWEHPLVKKARHRAHLAPVPKGWRRDGEKYIHSSEHPHFKVFLSELVNTTKVSLSHQPSTPLRKSREGNNTTTILENNDGNRHEEQHNPKNAESSEMDVPSSIELKQRRKALAGLNWENHSLKLEIKYLKRKLARVVYGEKPPPPRTDKATSRFRRHSSYMPGPPLNGIPDNSPQYKGPFFGVPLEELLQHEGEGAKIPYIPRKLLDFLEEDSVVATEGLFRLSPSIPQLSEIKSMLDKGEPLDWQTIRKDPHIAASLLKQFLRDLPNPILTPNAQIYSQFIDIQQSPNKEALPQFKVLIAALPKANRVFLRRWMADVVTKITSNSDKNKMNANALGVVFGSNIMRTKGEGTISIRKHLDRSISRSSGRMSSFSKSPNSLKEEMQRVQHINQITATLFSNPAVFGLAEPDPARSSTAGPNSARPASPAQEKMWSEGWGWSFQGPKFSVKGEEERLAKNQNAQYLHFTQHRHMYGQMIRALQAQPEPLAIAGLKLLDKAPTPNSTSRTLASLTASTLYDPITVDGLTSWRWLAEVAATWAGMSCTELCESVYGERGNPQAENGASSMDEEEIEDDDDDEDLFNFDEPLSPPLTTPNYYSNKKPPLRPKTIDIPKSPEDIPPAQFLAHVLMYFAKNREFIDYLTGIVKPVAYNLLNSPSTIASLNIQVQESQEGPKAYSQVEIDVDALLMVTTAFLETILTEEAISLIPADIVFVCRLLYKTGKFNQEPQYLFRWFFFRLYLLRALGHPEEYELLEDVTPTQQQVLRCVESVLTHVAQVPSSFPCPTHMHTLRAEDESVQNHISRLCEGELRSYVSRYRSSVDSLGQRIVLSPIVLHPLYKPPEFTGVVSTSLQEVYTLHRILLDLVADKGKSIITSAPLNLILETIREPPSSLRDDDDVFVILNLTNFISSVPTFTDMGQMQSADKSAVDEELDELVKIVTELKRQKAAYESSPKKSSIQMRSLNETIRKMDVNLGRHAILLQQVAQDYSQLKDAITLAHKYRQDLQDTKTALTKKLQLTFLDLLAAKQPEDIYPKTATTRVAVDGAPTSRPGSPMMRPSTPPRPSTPTKQALTPRTSPRPITPLMRTSTPTSLFPSTPPQPTPLVQEASMRHTASSFLERLQPHHHHSYSHQQESLPAPNSSDILSHSASNPLATLLASLFDIPQSTQRR